MKNINEIKKKKATIKLFEELKKGEVSALKDGYVDIKEVEKIFGIARSTSIQNNQH